MNEQGCIVNIFVSLRANNNRLQIVAIENIINSDLLAIKVACIYMQIKIDFVCYGMVYNWNKIYRNYRIDIA